MALLSDPSIGKHQLSRSPMWIGLETDAYVISPGFTFRGKLTPDASTNTVGGTFVFEFNGITVTLTIVSGTPDFDNNEVSDKGGLSDSAYAELLTEEFNKNYLLTKYFTITQDTDDILFESIELSDDFDLTIDSVLTDTGFELDYQFGSHHEGQDPSYEPNYKMLLEIFMESTHNQNDFEFISSQELDPDQGNKCFFDIKSIVDAKLSYVLPTIDLALAEENVLSVKRFYLRYLEKYGSPVEYKQVYKTDPWPSLKAGLNFIQNPDVTEAIENYYLNNKIFNTRQPRTKKISSTQREYLTIFGPDPVNTEAGKVDITNLRARITVYPLDGSDPEVITGDPFTVVLRKLYVFASGFFLIKDLFDDAGWEFSEINYFTFELIGNNNPSLFTSEAFSFYCDQDYYLDEKIFYFSNSDGAIDTFRATGRRILSDVNSGESYSVRLSYGYEKSDGETREVNRSKKQKGLVNTGFIDKDTNQWLSDFFLAERKWEQVGEDRLPIRITTEQKPFDESQVGRFNFDFEYEYCFTDRTINTPIL